MTVKHLLPALFFLVTAGAAWFLFSGNQDGIPVDIPRNADSAVSRTLSGEDAKHDVKLRSVMKEILLVKEQEKDRLNSNVADLLDELGDDELGRRAAAAVEQTARRAESGIYAARFFQSELGRAWKADPDRGVREIRELMERVDTARFPEFKIELIETLSRLPGKKGETFEVASREAINTRVPQAFELAGPGRIVSDPLTPYTLGTFEHAVRAADSDDEALRFATEAINSQSDPAVQVMMRDLLLSRHPRLVTRRDELPDLDGAARDLAAQVVGPPPDDPELREELRQVESIDEPPPVFPLPE